MKLNIVTKDPEYTLACLQDFFNNCEITMVENLSKTIIVYEVKHKMIEEAVFSVENLVEACSELGINEWDLRVY